jgi:para-nitrobenzyl esterase
LVDDEVILEQPLAAAAAGRLAPIPLLIGTCYDDYRPYPHILPPDTIPRDKRAVVQHFDRLDLDGAGLVRAYREWLGPIDPVSLFVASMSDLTFCQPAIHFAERHAAYHPVYAYDFKWASPVQNGAMGAGHRLTSLLPCIRYGRRIRPIISGTTHPFP